MRIRFAVLVVLLGLVFIFSAGCSDANVVARVNGEKIMRAELNKKVEEIKSGLKSQGFDFEGEQGKEILERVEEEALNQLINETLLMQEAEKQGVIASDKKVQEQLRQIKEQFGEENFKKLLEEQNLSEGDLAEQLRLQISADALFNKMTGDIKVDKQEARTFFDENKRDFEQLKVAHILISVAPDASKEEEESAKQRAVDLISKLKEGADFSSLAKAHSQDPQSAKNGGVMDMYFTRRDPFLMEEFIRGAFELGPGEFSKEPVRTAYGYHIIKVIDKRDTFDELQRSVEERLLSEKKNEAFLKFFSEVKENARIKNMLTK